MAHSKMLMLAFVALLALTSSGCIGDIDVPTEDPPPTTELTVNGISNGQLFNVSYMEFTVTDPRTKYHSFLYAVDSEKNYLPGTFSSPVTVTVSTEGDHLLYIKGVYGTGLSDAPMTLNFTVATAKRAGSGRYSGDSLQYYTNYSSMRVEFVEYSGARANDGIIGTFRYDDFALFSASGVSIDNQQTPTDIELLLSATTSPQSMRASGEGYYNYLNLKYVGQNTTGSSIYGDFKLYSRDLQKTLVAECSTMHAYSQSGLPDLRSIATLYSFDGRYFYGHIRLINPALKKVLTYDVKGDTGSTALEGSHGIPLTLSKPFGYLVKATPAPPATGTGYLLIDVDQSGEYQVAQFSVNLPSYAIYDSLPETVKMIRSFARQNP
jgi:hypothetical protein